MTRDARLITILLRGEFALNGFRNRDLRELLFPPAPTPKNHAGRSATSSTVSATTTVTAEAAALTARHRQSGQVTRLLRLFRAHGLIQKVPRTHRYQLTAAGRRILPTFPAARSASTQALNEIAA